MTKLLDAARAALVHLARIPSPHNSGFHALCEALRTAIAEEEAKPDDRDSVIKTLAEKFCRCPLPETVNADECATKAHTEHRSGTNLLRVVEAQQMLTYVLSDVALCNESHIHACRHPACVLAERDALIDALRAKLAAMESAEPVSIEPLVQMEGGEAVDIPIEAGKEIAERYGYDQVVIVARKVGDNVREHCTTYGVDKTNCIIAARIGNFIKHKIMLWPVLETPAPRPAYVPMTDDELRAALALLARYRKETPLGHQPHMIAHEVDAVLARLGVQHD